MSILSSILSLGPALLPALGAVGGALSGSKFVQEGQRGAKLRWGKVVRTRDGKVKVYRPGFTFIIPAIEHLHRTHVRVRTLNLEPQSITLKDKLVFEVGGLVQMKVDDTPEGIYAVLYETNGINDTVVDYVSGRLRDVVSEQTYEQALDRDRIIGLVTERITQQLAEWGVVLIDFRLTDCAPTAQSARAILLSVEAGMRADALAAAAAKLAGNLDLRRLSPAVAAALIGTPVATSLDNTTRTEVSYGEGTDD